MKPFWYLAGVAVCAAGVVVPLLGVPSFYAALLLCSGSLVAASTGAGKAGRRSRIADVSVLGAACAFLLYSTYTQRGIDVFAGFRLPWIGIPLSLAMLTIGILRARATAARSAP